MWTVLKLWPGPNTVENIKYCNWNSNSYLYSCWHEGKVDVPPQLEEFLLMGEHSLASWWLVHTACLLIIGIVPWLEGTKEMNNFNIFSKSATANNTQQLWARKRRKNQAMNSIHNEIMSSMQSYSALLFCSYTFKQYYLCQYLWGGFFHLLFNSLKSLYWCTSQLEMMFE